MPHSSRKHVVFSRYASHILSALCLQGVKPVRPAKPTHRLKSFSWTGADIPCEISYYAPGAVVGKIISLIGIMMLWISEILSRTQIR